MVKLKKVLFIIDTLEIGGAEQSLLVNTTRFRKIEPVICHLYKGETLKTNFLEKGIKVHSLNLKDKYGFVAAFRAVKEVVNQEKPDLLVGYITLTEIISRLVGKDTKVPVVGTFISDLYAHDYNQHLSWRAKRLVGLFKMLNRLTSKICVGFVANSKAIKEANAIHLDIHKNKIKVINRGRESYAIVKRQIPLTKGMDTIKFINVSRLFPAKGQKEMILGFGNYLKKYPNAILHIVGDGPYRPELEKTIKENNLENNVTLLGSRTDVPTLLCNYDCFVFPSFLEGFSGAIVEAMFAGVPVVASDIEPNREAITHLQTGYLFESKSVKAIEQALHWFTENILLAETFASRAYDYAKCNFELDNIVNEFEDYLLEASTIKPS